MRQRPDRLAKALQYLLSQPFGFLLANLIGIMLAGPFVHLGERFLVARAPLHLMLREVWLRLRCGGPIRGFD